MESAGALDVKEKRHYAWAILVACCVFSFGFGMTANCNGQYFVPVTRDLGFGMGQFTLYMTLSGFVQFGSMTMLNRVLNKVDFRILLSGCFLIRLICTALMGTFHSLWQWYAIGIFMGIFGPPCNLVIPPIVLSNWFIKKRGFAIGLAMTFSGIGGAVMTPVLAWIIQTYGWRFAYAANAVLAGIVVLPFYMFVIRLKPSDKGLKPYGYEEQAGHNGQGAAELGSQEASEPSGQGAVKSTVQGARLERGVMGNDALRSISFVFMLFIFCSTGFFGAYTQLLSAYGVSIGLLVTAAAALPSLSMVGNALTKMAMGIINDRFGGKAMMYSGLGITLFAMLLLLNGPNPVAGLYIGAFFAGTFLTVMSVSAPLLIHAVYGARDYSRLLVLLSLGQSLVISIAPSVIGFMFDFTGSYTLSFIVGAAVSVVACVSLHFAFATSKKLAWD
jgi:MFS family permease